eukprot:9595463-Ditylum_brightwellii.AAC.1
MVSWFLHAWVRASWMSVRAKGSGPCLGHTSNVVVSGGNDKGVVVALVVEDMVPQESKILIPSVIVVVCCKNLLPSTEYQHNNQLGDQLV